MREREREEGETVKESFYMITRPWERLGSSEITLKLSGPV